VVAGGFVELVPVSGCRHPALERRCRDQPMSGRLVACLVSRSLRVTGNEEKVLGCVVLVGSFGVWGLAWLLNTYSIASYELTLLYIYIYEFWYVVCGVLRRCLQEPKIFFNLIY
jgi:hypothetical protein